MIAITADIHFHNHQQFKRIDENGMNSRLKDALSCFEWIVDTAAKNHCEALIVAGDVFHSRKNIEHSVLDNVCRMFKWAESIMPVFVIAGNHDYSITGDEALSIQSLAGANTIIVEEPTIHEVQRISFGMLPYTSSAEKTASELKKLKDCKYLISHLGIHGAKVGPGDFEMPDEIPPSLLLKYSFKNIFLGHYHGHQTLADGKIVYVGSPLQLTFGEAGETKGFILLDEKKGKWSFVENKSSPHFIAVDYGKKKPNIRDNDYVKVITKINQLDDAQEEFKGAQVKFEVSRERQEFKERLKLYGKNNLDILKEYVKAHPPEYPKNRDKEEFHKSLIEEGLSLLEEAQ